MATLPLWAQWLQLGGTFVIAGFAASIAYRQWQTAHQKIVLDLFERRMKIFDDAREKLNGVVRTGHPTDQELIEFARIVERVKVLFGDEVVASAEKLNTALIELQAAKEMLKNIYLPAQERATHIAKSTECKRVIVMFFDEFPRLMRPYVRMTQKMR